MLISVAGVKGKSQHTLQRTAEMNGEAGVWRWHLQAFSLEDLLWGSSFYKQLGGEEPDELT